MKNIGGFFPLYLPAEKKDSNFLTLWDIPRLPHILFANSRSALNHVILLRHSKRVWLPAYSCTALAQSVKNTGADIHFFPVLPTLSPDVNYLKQRIQAGDIVLAIDYYGRNPDQEFLSFVLSSPDITWVEDRAQAMLPSSSPWGDFIIYSPRKLLGVPDGGILISKEQNLSPFAQSYYTSSRFVEAALLRYEDSEEAHNEMWYSYYKEYEDSMEVSSHAMSRISQFILAQTDPLPIMQLRKENYSYLMSALKDIAVLPLEDRSFIPFGFPIRVADTDRKKVESYLHSKKIFAARHWSELPSDGTSFPFEHTLSKQLLTLPLDQRYDARDMQNIVLRVREALS